MHGLLYFWTEENMHSLWQKASQLTEIVIAAAIEVHRDKGPGLLESIYEWCLLKELELRGLAAVNQRSVIVRYKGFQRESLCASMC